MNAPTDTGSPAAAAPPSGSPAPVLSVRGLSVRFVMRGGRRIAAVSDAAFDLAPGECLALVGESGCGKSVLAAALLGLLPGNARTAGSARLNAAGGAAGPDAGDGGTIELLTASEQELARTVRGRRIGLVPQSPAAHLTPVRTVRAQLEETVRELTGSGGPGRVRTRSGRPTGRPSRSITSTAIRTSSPAASRSAPPPRSRSSGTPRCCSPTSPPPDWTAIWWSAPSTNCAGTPTTAARC